MNVDAFAEPLHKRLEQMRVRVHQARKDALTAGVDDVRRFVTVSYLCRGPHRHQPAIADRQRPVRIFPIRLVHCNQVAAQNQRIDSFHLLLCLQGLLRQNLTPMNFGAARTCRPKNQTAADSAP